MNKTARGVLYTLILLLPVIVMAAEEESSASMVKLMPNLVIQIGLIIFAARIGAMVFEKLNIPGVLGEIVIGIIIGPYLLGAVPMPGFPSGIFAMPAELGFPIRPELYGIAIIASVVLLFMSGLETDINLFVRFAFAGTLVGIGGIITSFFLGAGMGYFFFHVGFFSPTSLFLGIMSTATSVGITARILSENKKMDTPEGVTILAGAVIDDVLGVILLAIVLGLSLAMQNGMGLEWGQIGRLAFKEIGIWLGFTAVGLYFSKQIGTFLKRFKNRFVFSVLAFSMALIIAGLFEHVGLAMIIGAYAMGLILSKTDISHTIIEALHPLQIFFVPVFFVVMGMLVNVQSLLSTQVLLIGGVYSLGALLAKFLGCGLPALAVNFNRMGAMRIGVGMIPRGEVALVIAGIGLSYGFLDDTVFSIAILMTLVSTLAPPPLLKQLLKKDITGVRHQSKLAEKVSVVFDFSNSELTQLMMHKLLLLFEAEGFYINRMDPDKMYFYLRRDEIFITLGHERHRLIFSAEREYIRFIHRIVMEAAFYLKQNLQRLISFGDEEMLEKQTVVLDAAQANVNMGELLLTENIILKAKSVNKAGVIQELVEMLQKNGCLTDGSKVLNTVLLREQTLSSGLINGVAIPHVHLDRIKKSVMAVGICPNGVDFNAIDNQPTRLVLFIATPEIDAEAHVKVLAYISRLTQNHQAVENLVTAASPGAFKEQFVSTMESFYNEQ